MLTTATPAAEPAALPDRVGELPITLAVVILPGEGVPPDVRLLSRLGPALAGKDARYRVHLVPPEDWNADRLVEFDPARFDALMLLCPSLPRSDLQVSPAAGRALLRNVGRGLGLIVVHGALAAFGDWREYHEMLGYTVAPRAPDDDAGAITSRLIDRMHPASQALPSQWLIAGPPFRLVAPSPSAALHLIIGPDAWDDSQAGPANSAAPIAWARWCGGGRVFCTVAGDSEALEDEDLLAHLRGAIEWSLGQFVGDPPPPGAAPIPWSTTPSGVRYVDERVGEGDVPRVLTRARIHLRGTRGNGSVLQDTRGAGEPLEFPVGVRAVIQGLEEGIMSMRVGGRRRLIIPPELRGKDNEFDVPLAINEPVYFDVELLGVGLAAGALGQRPIP